MQLKRKKTPSDDRVREFCEQFNAEILDRAKDFPRAVGVRGAIAEGLRLCPEATVAEGMVRARQMVGAFRPASQPPSEKLRQAFVLTATAIEHNATPAEVAALCDTLLSALDPEDARLLENWASALKDSPPSWLGVAL